jgi:hypothetical protein
MLSDGRALGIYLADGVGTQKNLIKTSTEDFIYLDGKIYKLEMTLLFDNFDDLMSVKVLKTN